MNQNNIAIKLMVQQFLMFLAVKGKITTGLVLKNTKTNISNDDRIKLINKVDAYLNYISSNVCYYNLQKTL